jgi:hypothetical protein
VQADSGFSHVPLEVRHPAHDETKTLLLPERSWSWYIPLTNYVVSVGIVGAAENVFHDDDPQGWA